MGFARAGPANQYGTLMLAHELAVKQPQHLLLGDLFGELEVVIFQRFSSREAGLSDTTS